jgi:hypothetical protein
MPVGTVAFVGPGGTVARCVVARLRVESVDAISNPVGLESWTQRASAAAVVVAGSGPVLIAAEWLGT